MNPSGCGRKMNFGFAVRCSKIPPFVLQIRGRQMHIGIRMPCPLVRSVPDGKHELGAQLRTLRDFIAGVMLPKTGAQSGSAGRNTRRRAP
jgi:hypothetical protein